MLKKFWMGIVTILCAIAITITINYAWFVSGYDVDPLATGSSVDAYYLKGSGTELDPYIITTPRHLYNLAWLQYLGTYNKPTTQGGTAYESTYFKLGTTANGTLNMTGWPLPPIGTAKYPFIGNFNGNGWTISNLTTTNNFTEFGDKHPSGISADGANGTDAFEQANCGTIGFFGAIGAYNNFVISDTVTTSTEGVSYPTTTNTATNFYLNNTSVHTSISSTILGAVAGYVNATISNIGVIQPHLNIQVAQASSKLDSKTSNLSDFAVVGYAESQYTTQKTKSSTIIYNPTYNLTHFNFKGMGDMSNWGGSMNMNDLYNRILAYKNSGSTLSYYKNDTRIVNQNLTTNNTTHSYSNNTTPRATSNYYYYRYLEASNEESGAYAQVNRTDRDQYLYLSGFKMDVNLITITTETKNGIKIKSGNVYLDRNNSSITNNGNGDTVWIVEGSSIYTYVDNLDTFSSEDYNKYYLNASTTALSLTTTSTTSWSWDSNYSTFKFTSGNADYGIVYDNGWKISLLNRYKITDGNGHYLSLDSSRNIINSNENDAIAWTFSTIGTNPSGTISTKINGTTYYLYYNNGLVVSTSSTSWSNSGSGIYYSGNYIQYRQTENGVYQWIASSNRNNVSMCYITDNNDNYLSLDNSGNIINQSSAEDATLWAFTTMNENPSGYIFTEINGTTYYLSYSNGLTTSTTQTTSWNNAGDGLYYSGNYIQFRDGKWIASSDRTTSTRYRITDGNGNYLSINGTNVVNETSESDAIGWTFSNTSGTYPKGTISTTINGSTYYLKYNSGLTLATSTTTWGNDGTGLYNSSNYIRFDGSKWIATNLTGNQGYYISDGKGNYLSVSGTSLANATSTSDAILWTFSNYSGSGTISTIINSTTYYLRYNNGLQLSTSSTNWTNNNGRIYDSSNRHIQYSPNSSGTYSWMASNEYHYVSSESTNYLSHNGTTINNETNKANATLWHFSSGGTSPEGSMCDYAYSSSYYVRPGNGSLSLSDTSTSLSNSSDELYRSSGSRTYYIYFNSPNWTGSRYYSTSLTFTQPQLTLTYQNVTYTNSQVSNSYTSTYVRSYVTKVYDSIYNASSTTAFKYNYNIGRDLNVSTYIVTREEITEATKFTYAPLNTTNNTTSGTVKDNNTGYIISGSNESTSTKADIRVSYYAIGNIADSYSSGSFSTIYTIYTNNNTNQEVALSSSGKTYVKYTDSLSQLSTTLSKDTTNVYGLHFVDANINMDNLVIAPKVIINGKTYTNYEMPEDCIDFNLKSKGYINFFAGAYYPGNTAFFSLHQIERDSNKKIVAINHISKIYKNSSNEYCYELTGATKPYSTCDENGTIIYHNSKPSEYNTLEFDCSWLESPNLSLPYYNSNSEAYYSKKLFYFEIPVNAGEYALGSVENKTGAYLIYLDIGANATSVDRTEIMQESIRTTQDFTYVNGIQLLATGSTYSSDANSAVAIIAASQTGTFDFSRSGNTITTPALNSTYFDDNLTCSNLSITVPSASITTKVLKYIDYTSDNKLYHTTVKDVDGNQTYKVELINGNTTQLIVDTNSTQTQINAAPYALLKIPTTGNDAGYGIQDTASNALSSHASSFSTSTKILDYYFFIPTSQKNSIVEDIEMNVERVTGNATLGSFIITNGNYSFTNPAYQLTHCYQLTGNSINLQPNGLLVYIGPDTKANATITGPTDNIATVTISGNSYTFTFNASAIDNTAKTITIYYVAPE